MMDVNTLMACFGRSADAVNLLEIVGYLKESKLARKVSGFAESLEEKEGKRSTAARHASIAAFRGVEALLLSLTDARDDGRVILSKEDGTVLKYVLLNPAERFAEVVSAARSVVLAGGTMEPVSSPFSKPTPARRFLHPALPLDPARPVRDALLRARHPQDSPPHAGDHTRSPQTRPRVHFCEAARPRPRERHPSKADSS